MLNVSWYDPDVYLTDTGDLKITQRGSASSPITRIGAFADVVAGKIRSGIIETKKLIVDGVDILKKLQELSGKVESQQQEIETLKRQIQKLQQ